MNDWAVELLFRVAAAGKGTKYLSGYHRLTPEEVWDHYCITADEAKAAGMRVPADASGHACKGQTARLCRAGCAAR